MLRQKVPMLLYVTYYKGSEAEQLICTHKNEKTFNKDYRNLTKNRE